MRRLLYKKDKKGLGIGDIYPIVLTIALVAILITVVIYILSSMQTQPGFTSYMTTVNETGWANGTTYQVQAASACGFNNPALIVAYNGSLGPVIPNVSINSAGYVTNTTITKWALLNLSYSYYAGNASCNALSAINTNFSNFVPWIGIILLIVAAAIVLGILIRSLGGGGQQRI